MKWRLRLLRLILVAIALLNGILGLIGFLAQGELSLKISSLIYGATLSALSPQVYYLIKWLGCSFLGIAVFALLAIRDPEIMRRDFTFSKLKIFP